jgi:hypothetical protein
VGRGRGEGSVRECMAKGWARVKKRAFYIRGVQREKGREESVCMCVWREREKEYKEWERRVTKKIKM